MFFVLTAPIDIQTDTDNGTISHDVGEILSADQIEIIRRSANDPEAFVTCVVCFDVAAAMDWQEVVREEYDKNIARLCATRVI